MSVEHPFNNPLSTEGYTIMKVSSRRYYALRTMPNQGVQLAGFTSGADYVVTPDRSEIISVCRSESEAVREIAKYIKEGTYTQNV